MAICKPNSHPVPVLLQSLGTMPDTALAKQFKLSVKKVRELRRQHGIAVFKRPPAKTAFRWPRNIRHLLQTYRNTELSTKLGIPKAALTYKRQILGIEQPDNEKLLALAKRRQAALTMYQQGMAKSKIMRELGLSFGGLSYILERARDNPVAPPSEWPQSIDKPLTTAGFRSKLEVRRVFDHDPSYLLAMPGIGQVVLAEIAAWLNRPNPLPLNIKAIQFYAVRKINGEFRAIQCLSEPIRHRQDNVDWKFLDVETGRFTKVILGKSGYRRLTNLSVETHSTKDIQ